jgi:hypothetical protein
MLLGAGCIQRAGGDAAIEELGQTERHRHVGQRGSARRRADARLADCLWLNRVLFDDAFLFCGAHGVDAYWGAKE